MNKLLLLALTFTLGFISTTYSQSTPLYVGFNYNSQYALMDTTGGAYSIVEYRDLISPLDDVNGCYGLALHPITKEMYILYQLDMDGASNRRLGVLDTLSGDISDIGFVGNMIDIAFQNTNLFGISGSYSGHGIYSIDITDGTTSLLLSPSTDNEAGSLTNNIYSGNLIYVDEDHFTTINTLDNTEDVDPVFTSFDDECNAITMKNDSIALVSNYNDLYEFNINTYVLTYINSYINNLHGMAFGDFPLAVTINGPTLFCSSEVSLLSISIEGSIYQWTLDGVDILGATEATYEPTISGAYACIVDGVLTQNSITVEVIPSPEVTFTANPNPVFLGEDPAGTVDFTNTTPIGDSFMWDFDNGFTTALENPSFSFAEAGTYDVTLWVTDSETGCTGSTIVTVIVNEGLGININENEFSVYPTITSNLVSVNYTGNSAQITGSLMDMNGRIIETKTIQTNGITTFDLSQVENGTYIIRISNGTSIGTIYKVVKN